MTAPPTTTTKSRLPGPIQCLAQADAIGRRIFKIPASVQDTGLRWPGFMGWAPESLLVVITELHYYPDHWVAEDRGATERRWTRWEDLLSHDVFGVPVYFESINAAVTALYKE